MCKNIFIIKYKAMIYVALYFKFDKFIKILIFFIECIQTHSTVNDLNVLKLFET